ncbi:MAG: hypothetical protein J6I49_06000 [Bacteroidales bacterium]|nr:hypothetical protein [Bacteroidales bacterium]
MAKIEQGILGPFRGKVGTVVGFLWRGRHVVRGYRKEINYPNTENQRLERDWFVSMVRFAATARQALLLGFREKAAQWQMTEGNAFVRENKRCFAKCDGGSVVDYKHISISQGPAAPVIFTGARLGGDGVLEVGFERNSGMTRAKAADRVYVYIYHTATRAGLLSAPAERRAGRLRVQLPDGWAAQEVRLWGFVVDKEGRASGSAYIDLEREDRPEGVAANDSLSTHHGEALHGGAAVGEEADDVEARLHPRGVELDVGGV